MIFKRKNKKLENFDAIGLINDIALPLTPFGGGKITNSDVVLICIDRIASQCAKLKGRCIKRSEGGIITERNKSLFFCWSQYEEIISFLFETYNLNFSFSRKFAKTWLNLDYVYYKFPNHQYCKNLQGKTYVVFWLFSGCFLVAIEL